MDPSDRNFAKFGPGSSSGLGNLRFISVNTWIIVANVAVFLIGMLLSQSQLNVYTSMGVDWVDGVTHEQLARAVKIDQIRTDPATGWYYKPIVDPKATEINPKTGVVQLKEIARDRFVYMNLIESVGHFSTARALEHFQVWRVVTFQFLHYNWIHLLFNMLGLWFVGGMVEQHLGSKRYAAFYLTCGIFGALFYLLLNFVGFLVSQIGGDSAARIPGLLFNDTHTPLIGASAGVFGVLIAAARLEPAATVWVYFLIPVRLKFAVITLMLITIYNLFTGSRNAGGEAAHVGGAIAGFYFVRRIYLLRDFFDILGNSRLPEKERPASGRLGDARALSENERAIAALRREVERILDKINAHGSASLTPAEIKTLSDYNALDDRG